MKEEEFYVLTFNSTHHAIKGEKLLKNKKIDIKMIPTPRDITASCGLSIKFQEGVLTDVEEGIRNKDLLIDGLYKIIRAKNEKKAIKIK